MMNRFKELDMVDRVPEELWAKIHTLYRGQWCNHTKEKEMQEGKVAVSRGLRNICEKRRSEVKGEKARYIQVNSVFQRTAKSDRKVFLSEHVKK